MKKIGYLSLLLSLPFTTNTFSVTTEQTQINARQTDIAAHVQLSKEEQIYLNTIVVSANNPDVQLSHWKTDYEATQIYDKRRKDSALGFNKDFTILTSATKQTDTPTIDATVHVTMANAKDFHITETQIPVTFSKIQILSDDAQSGTNTEQASTPSHYSTQKESPSFRDRAKKIQHAIQNRLTETDSWSLQLFLALLLGILLSLTPCIYPMIPITLGVLQSQGSKSVTKNFFLSFAYTLGISTTFALMGLLASYTGEAFGSMLSSPIFVVVIVVVLSYFALSLFGLYNIYIPRFLQNKSNISAGGSFLSIFMFGLMSGTVASPCLSPGLALILSMVAKLANKFLGFLLLFAFGIGISTPLLIMGTFSGSMNVLPKAGMWMLEIQKFFGFMLFGMCFYYMSNVLPWWLILIMLTVFILCAGIYYLRSVTKQDSIIWRNIKNALGVSAISVSVFLMVESFQELYYPKLDDGVEVSWYTDYNKAVSDAKKQNKKLLVDFWTPACSICKKIANDVLKAPAIAKELEADYIVATINGSDSGIEPFKSLKANYGVQGFPTILIINPKTGKELHRWTGELEDEEHKTIIAELKQFAD